MKNVLKKEMAADAGVKERNAIGDKENSRLLAENEAVEAEDHFLKKPEMRMLAENKTDELEEFAVVQKHLDETAQFLEAERMLAGYRQELMAAPDEAAFEKLAKDIDSRVKKQVKAGDGNGAFWDKFGTEIMTANKRDTENILRQKAPDFSRKKLEGVLATAQEMLATSFGSGGAKVLETGLQEIAKAPFLEEQERELYRSEYLKSGLLNLALNDPEQAEALCGQLVKDGSDGEIKQKISQVRNLNTENALNLAKHEEELRTLRQAEQEAILWQKKMRGDMDAASYYVLSAHNGTAKENAQKDGEDAQALVSVYQVMRRLNREADKTEGREIMAAERGLKSAFEQGVIDFEQAASLQNLMLALKNNAKRTLGLCSEALDETVDRLFFADAPQGGGFDKIMEAKAKFALKFYEDYFNTVDTMMAGFEENGGYVSGAVRHKLAGEALKEIKNNFGIKENMGEVWHPAALRRTLKSIYPGGDEETVWQRFCAEAPYAEDKGALMRKLAEDAVRKDSLLPHFDSVAALRRAGLGVGEKFYFKGRLAVMKG